MPRLVSLPVPSFSRDSCRVAHVWSLASAPAASPLVLPSWGVPSLELMVSTATTGTDVRLVVTVDGSSPSCTSAPPSAHTVVSRVTSLTLAESGVVTVKAAACRSGVTGSTVTTQEVYVAGTCVLVVHCRTWPLVQLPAHTTLLRPQRPHKTCIAWRCGCEM